MLITTADERPFAGITAVLISCFYRHSSMRVQMAHVVCLCRSSLETLTFDSFDWRHRNRRPDNSRCVFTDRCDKQLKASKAIMTWEGICRFISHEAWTNPRKSRRLHAIQLIAADLHGSLSLHPCCPQTVPHWVPRLSGRIQARLQQSIDSNSNVSCGGFASRGSIMARMR